METIKKIFVTLRNLYKKLDFEQKKVLSDLFKGLALSSFLPVIMRLLTDDKSGDDLGVIFLLLVCAILSSFLAVLVLAKEKE